MPASAFENDWDVWVYPPKVDTQPPPGVVVDRGLERPGAGGAQRRRQGAAADPARPGEGRQARQSRARLLQHLLEHRLDPSPAAHDARHLMRSQASGAGGVPDGLPQQLAMVVSGQPGRRHDPRRPAAGLRPTVQVIDDWVTARKLGLVFEARMGAGKLLVCSIDLSKDPEHNPVARQMLHSLLGYMAGPKFKPAVTLTPAAGAEAICFGRVHGSSPPQVWASSDGPQPVSAMVGTRNRNPSVASPSGFGLRDSDWRRLRASEP